MDCNRGLHILHEKFGHQGILCASMHVSNRAMQESDIGFEVFNSCSLDIFRKYSWVVQITITDGCAIEKKNEESVLISFIVPTGLSTFINFFSHFHFLFIW